MDLFNKRMARKRALTLLRVQNHCVLQKRNRKENTETNISNLELEFPESEIEQEQNCFNNNIQPPIDTQEDFYLENETYNSRANTTREDDALDVPEDQLTTSSSISLNSSVDTREEIISKTVNNLREWAFQFPPISHSRLDSLLNILRPIIPQLPKSSKTFLQTICEDYKIEKLDLT